VGFEKAPVNESKPDRRAAQQRLKQQVQIQLTIHTVLIGHFAVLVKSYFLGFPARTAQTGLVFWTILGYEMTMSTLQEIKAAIPKLTLEERAEVARCLHGWTDDEWDDQMKRDLAAGKLDPLLKKVDADIDGGQFSELP
jgi:hypothetical protein